MLEFIVDKHVRHPRRYRPKSLNGCFARLSFIIGTAVPRLKQTSGRSARPISKRAVTIGPFRLSVRLVGPRRSGRAAMFPLVPHSEIQSLIGNRTLIVVPASCSLSIEQSPPSSRTRSVMPSRPKPWVCDFASKPQPKSRTSR